MLRRDFLKYSVALGLHQRCRYGAAPLLPPNVPRYLFLTC